MKLRLFAVAQLLLCSALATATELTFSKAPPPPPLQAKWTDPSGNETAETLDLRTSWVWDTTARPNAQRGTPAMRVDMLVRFREKGDYTGAVGKDAHLIAAHRDQRAGANTWRFTIYQTSSKASVEFFDARNQQRAQIATLNLVTEPRAPILLTEKECPNHLITYERGPTEGNHLFLGTSCTEEDGKIILYFVRSTDAAWEVKDLKAEDAQAAFVYNLPIPQETTVYERTIRRTITTKDAEKKPTEFTVHYESRIKPRPWNFSAGLGYTFFRYNEVGLALTTTQHGLTAKAGASYRLIPKLLNIDISGFRTLYAKIVTPSSGTPSAIFTGINGRLGYRLPIDIGATEWYFLAGLYRWSMDVAGDAYGVKPLSGPQLFIQMTQAEKGRHAFYIYGKFASISDGIEYFQVKNKELAVGGGYALSTSATPFMLTLDLAETKFAKEENAMKLNTVSLGIGKRF